MDDGQETASNDGLLPISGSTGQQLKKMKKLTYKQMITEAIGTLKENRGSSRQSILKYITSKYALGKGSNARVNSTITRMLKNRQLLRTRGTLEDGSFKLNSRHSTPFASAGRSKRRGLRRGHSKRRGKKSKKRRTKRRGKLRKKVKKGKRRGKSIRTKRGKKRKTGRSKIKKRSKPYASFFSKFKY